MPFTIDKDFNVYYFEWNNPVTLIKMEVKK